MNGKTMKKALIAMIISNICIMAVQAENSSLEFSIRSILDERAKLIEQGDLDGDGKFNVLKELAVLCDINRKIQMLDKELAGITTAEGIQIPHEPLPAEQLKPFEMPVYGLDANDPCCVAEYILLKATEYKGWETF